jgi:hypothetical protein
VNDVLLPGEAVLLDPSAWALRINACWRKGIESIIGTGRLLLEAKDSCSHGDFEAMLRHDLAFQPRTAQRLMAIARDHRLTNPTHASLLPASWTTLYELTQLSDDEFDRAIEQNVIRPDMERKDVEIIRPTPHRGATHSDGLCPVPPGDVAGDDANGLRTKGEADDSPSAHRSPLTSISGSLAPDIGTTQCEDRASPGPSEAAPDAPAAHMAGRVQPAGDLDYSPTPPWATRALIERVLRRIGREGHCKFQSAWEPACGEGHMAEVLREYFSDVFATDIHDRNGYPDARNDFLSNDGRGPGAYDWIITNPPFEERVILFMERALDLAGTGVAMFLQLRYLEGIGRYERIFRDRPPTIVAPFVERVPLVMGRYDPEASTATAFMWLVWLKGAPPQAPFWIPPGCKAALTKPDDAARFTQHPVEKRVHTAPPPDPSPPPPKAKVEDYPDMPEALRRRA